MAPDHDIDQSFQNPLKRFAREFRVARCVRDASVPEAVLDGASVVPIVRELAAASVSEHMWMSREGQRRLAAGSKAIIFSEVRVSGGRMLLVPHRAMATAMSNLDQLRPTERNRVIDLVREAGVDVADWGNYKGGTKNAASNPKYCYDWSFVQPNQVVVLNLWHENIEEVDGVVFHKLNFRRSARKHKRSLKRAIWDKRARKMDDAVQAAVNDRLPIRVVICDGVIRDRNDPDAVASKVERRLLDPVRWAVTNYDPKTGKCTLTRGAYSQVFVDQFSVEDPVPAPPDRRPVTGLAFIRNPDVRKRALERADGRCEWCLQRGFVMADGRIYLETHHLTSLAEGGSDKDDNVVALCPNHHREAHFGQASARMTRELASKLQARSAERPPLTSGARRRVRTSAFSSK